MPRRPRLKSTHGAAGGALIRCKLLVRLGRYCSNLLIVFRSSLVAQPMLQSAFGEWRRHIS